MSQSTDLNADLQNQFVDILELYANYFIEISAKNHNPKNITIAVFKANVKNLKQFKIKELKNLDNAVIEKKFNPTSINYLTLIERCQ